jgi:hypothetical protein
VFFLYLLVFFFLVSAIQVRMARMFTYGGRNGGGRGRVRDRDVVRRSYRRSFRGKYASMKKIIEKLEEKMIQLELDAVYGKKTSVELASSSGMIDLYRCGTKLEPYYFEVPITSALRTMVGSSEPKFVFVTGAAVTLTIRPGVDIRVMLQSFNLGANSGVPLLEMEDQKDGTFCIANVNGSGGKELEVGALTDDRVQQFSGALYKHEGIDGTWFDAPLKDSVTVLPGDMTCGDEKNKSHNGMVDIVFSCNEKKGNPALKRDQTSTDTIRFYVYIGKEVSLAQNGNCFIGDHLTILGAVGMADDVPEPFVGPDGIPARPFRYGGIEKVKVQYYFRKPE